MLCFLLINIKMLLQLGALDYDVMPLVLTSTLRDFFILLCWNDEIWFLHVFFAFFSSFSQVNIFYASWSAYYYVLCLCVFIIS